MSAVIEIGYTDEEDGTAGEQPWGTVITGCAVSELGLLEKQSSALFLGKTPLTRFEGNLAFNGPRAMINLCVPLRWPCALRRFSSQRSLTPACARARALGLRALRRLLTATFSHSRARAWPLSLHSLSNDGFGGGHNTSLNAMWNTCRETVRTRTHSSGAALVETDPLPLAFSRRAQGDHGPMNSWQVRTRRSARRLPPTPALAA